MRGNHFLETQSNASRNRADVHRRPTPPDQPKSGGGGCSRSYELMILGDPSSGDVTITLTYNAVSEDIVIPSDSTASEVKALFDAHSEYVADSVESEVESAGNLPGSNMIITLPAGSIPVLSATNTLVRRAGGFYPSVNLFICCR